MLEIVVEVIWTVRIVQSVQAKMPDGKVNAVLYEDNKEDSIYLNQDCLDNSVFVAKEYSSGDQDAR